MSHEIAPITLTVFLGPIPLGEIFDRLFEDFQRQGQANPELLTEHKWWHLECDLAASLEEEGPTGQRLIDQLLSVAIGYDVTVREFAYDVAYHRQKWVASIGIRADAIDGVHGEPTDDVFGHGRAKRIAATLGLVLARKWSSYILRPVPMVSTGQVAGHGGEQDCHTPLVG